MCVCVCVCVCVVGKLFVGNNISKRARVHWFAHNFIISNNNRECPHGVMVKALDCGIAVSKFELQSRNYVSDEYHWEIYEPLYPPSYG